MRECHDMAQSGGLRRQRMLEPDEVQAMLGLHRRGWGTRRIAREFGCSRNTVRRYVEVDGWVAYGGAGRGGKLAGLDGWLEGRFRQHRGNAEVVRQDLERELSIEVSLRTVERAVEPYRRLLAAEAKGDGAVRDGAGSPAADRLRHEPGAGRRRGGSRASVRGDPGVLAADLREGVRQRAPVGVVCGPGGRVPALRRRPVRGAGGQPQAAGGASRPGHARGGVQRPVPGVRGALGVPAPGLRVRVAVSSPGSPPSKSIGVRRRVPSVRPPAASAGTPAPDQAFRRSLPPGVGTVVLASQATTFVAGTRSRRCVRRPICRALASSRAHVEAIARPSYTSTPPPKERRTHADQHWRLALEPLCG